MRSLKTLKKLFLVFVVITSVFYSCESDDEPNYTGTWNNKFNVVVEGALIEYNDKIILSKNQFEESYQILNPNTNKWIDLIGIKGRLLVDEDVMNFVVTEAGSTTYNSYTGMPTGMVTYYKETDEKFNAMLDTLGIGKFRTTRFNISRRQMTFMYDYSGDGDYSDEGETTIYTKE